MLGRGAASGDRVTRVFQGARGPFIGSVGMKDVTTVLAPQALTAGA